jgi:hypothetical protein
MKVPSWILDGADTIPADPPDLLNGVHTTVARLASVVRYGLQSIAGQIPSTARHGVMRLTRTLRVEPQARRLTVQIRCVVGDNPDAEWGSRPNRVEIWLHDAGLQDMVERRVGPADSTLPVPSHLLPFLHTHKWALPDALHGVLTDATGQQWSKEWPRPQRDPLLVWDDPMAAEVQWQTAVDVAAVLHVGFELGKESGVIVRTNPL